MLHYSLLVATANINSMSYQNSNPAPDSRQPVPSGFGSQTQMGLAEVLQMCCLSHRSGQITFRSGESYGFIYVQHGRVLHALCGVNEGEEAVYLMLSWPGGGFTLDEDILPHKRTVTLTWEQLLFEGARRADFNAGGPKQPAAAPVTTLEPATSTRAQDSQPKLTVVLPDQPPIIFELEEEYTHVGRAAGNEIPLAYSSVSNRHCIFILSGSDVVLRDLNSSNGTSVNGESITEVILRPGDSIQVGVVQMKFEPAMKRPKLTNLNAPVPPPRTDENDLQPVEPSNNSYSRVTTKLPTGAPSRSTGTVKDNSVYVKGQSAINYEDLEQPEQPKQSSPWPKVIGGVVLLLAVVGGAYYYFFLLH